MTDKALKGTIRGANRDMLAATARVMSREYFSIDCVAVKLENEKPDEEVGGFTADFTGVVWHDVEPRAFGPGRCRMCGKSDWPQAPLNPKTPEEWE